MKTIRFFAIFMAAFALLAVSAEAQKRKPAPKRTATKSVSTTITSSADMRSAKEKVASQITNVTKFNEALGPIADGIEKFDADARGKKVSKAATDINESNKRKVMQAIRNLRAGLAALEVEFRTKPALKKYLFKIQGINDLSGQSEDLALSGRFKEASTPLLAIIQKLTDTAAAMP